MTNASLVPKRLCSVDGCGRRHHSNGYCMTHLMRWRRTGSVDAPAARAPKLGKCSIRGCGHFGKLKRDWCPLHYGRWHRYGDPLHTRPSAEERFWPKVNKDGPVPECRPDLGPCWPWTAGTARGGYGKFTIRPGVGVMAHRFSYTMERGPIPDGLQLDHLCRNPPCVNPDHLEPVTCRENLLRGNTFQARNAAKTHCDAGHEFTPANTRITRTGRSCKACAKVNDKRRRAKAKAIKAGLDAA